MDSACQGLLALDDKALQKIFRALVLSRNPRRDRALLQLFLHFGCSVKDVTSLEAVDVDLPGGRIRWHRNGQERYAPLPQAVLQDLKTYWQRERRARTARFFTSRMGHPLTHAQVLQLFRTLQKETAIQELHPYGLRQRHQALLRQRTPLPSLVAQRLSLPYTPSPADAPVWGEQER